VLVEQSTTAKTGQARGRKGWMGSKKCLDRAGKKAGNGSGKGGAGKAGGGNGSGKGGASKAGGKATGEVQGKGEIGEGDEVHAGSGKHQLVLEVAAASGEVPVASGEVLAPSRGKVAARHVAKIGEVLGLKPKTLPPPEVAGADVVPWFLKEAEKSWTYHFENVLELCPEEKFDFAGFGVEERQSAKDMAQVKIAALITANPEVFKSQPGQASKGKGKGQASKGQGKGAGKGKGKDKENVQVRPVTPDAVQTLAEANGWHKDIYTPAKIMVGYYVM
jgi:hypothetical protein